MAVLGAFFQEKEGRCFQASWGLGFGTQTMLFLLQSIGKQLIRPTQVQVAGKLTLSSVRRSCEEFVDIFNELTQVRGLCLRKCVVCLKNCFPCGDSWSTQRCCNLLFLVQFLKSCFHHYLLNLSSHPFLQDSCYNLHCLSLCSHFSWVDIVHFHCQD